MNEIKRIYQANRLQTITFVISIIVAVISTIVAFIIWQQAITLRVMAVETTISSQQATLQIISEKLDVLGSRGMINTQRIQDTNDKVYLIYQFFKK